MIEVLAAFVIQAGGQDALLVEGLPQCRTYSEKVRDGEETIPAIGVERSAEVGEPMLIASRYEVRAGSTALAEAIVINGQTSRAPFTLTIPAGAEITTEEPGLRAVDFDFQGRGPRPTSVHIQSVTDGAPIARISWGWFKERHPVTGGAVRLEHSQCVTLAPNSLTRQIAFTGVSRGSVSIEYREFAGDLARPAFTQSATYDLADGSVIGFRGARIEVVSADNTGVRYRVLEPFD